MADGKNYLVVVALVDFAPGLVEMKGWLLAVDVGNSLVAAVVVVGVGGIAVVVADDGSSIK